MQKRPSENVEMSTEMLPSLTSMRFFFTRDTL
jgi:hypothetical protein